MVVFDGFLFKPTKAKGDATNGWQYCGDKIGTNPELFETSVNDILYKKYRYTHTWSKKTNKNTS